MNKVTPDTLKPYLAAFIHTLDVAKLLIPTTTPVGEEICQITNLVEGIAGTVWFAELLCYLINTFGNTKPTQEELVHALKEFAKKLGEDNITTSITVQ